MKSISPNRQLLLLFLSARFHLFLLNETGANRKHAGEPEGWEWRGGWSGVPKKSICRLSAMRILNNGCPVRPAEFRIANVTGAFCERTGRLRSSLDKNITSCHVSRIHSAQFKVEVVFTLHLQLAPSRAAKRLSPLLCTLSSSPSYPRRGARESGGEAMKWIRRARGVGGSLCGCLVTLQPRFRNWASSRPTIIGTASPPSPPSSL